jgi:hypothetical protein
MERATDEIDDPRDCPGDGKWLNYDELSLIRGISRPSAIRLVRRERWRRTKGNDQTARVFVPGDWLKPAGKRSPGQSSSNHPDATGDLSRITNAFESAVMALREQLEVANRQIGDERQRATRAEARAQIVEQDAARWWAQGRWRRIRAAWRGRRN